MWILEVSMYFYSVGTYYSAHMKHRGAEAGCLIWGNLFCLPSHYIRMQVSSACRALINKTITSSA